MVFAFLLTFGMASIQADAATKTNKLTLINGEKISLTPIGGTLTKVTTSKKSVVAVKKQKGKAILSAKKKGKAKIVIKTNRGSSTYNVSVVGKKFDVKFAPLNDNYCIVSFKNNTSVYFEHVKINVTFRDVNGNVLSNYTETLYEVGAKKKAISDCYYNLNYNQRGMVDLSKTTYTVDWFRTDYRYQRNSDCTKKVKYNVVDNGRALVITTSYPCKKNQSVYAGFSVYFYDAAGKVVGVKDFYNYMYSSRKSSSYTMSKPSEAVKWSLVNKRAYLRTY